MPDQGLLPLQGAFAVHDAGAPRQHSQRRRSMTRWRSVPPAVISLSPSSSRRPMCPHAWWCACWQPPCCPPGWDRAGPPPWHASWPGTSVRETAMWSAMRSWGWAFSRVQTSWRWLFLRPLRTSRSCWQCRVAPTSSWPRVFRPTSSWPLSLPWSLKHAWCRARPARPPFLRPSFLPKPSWRPTSWPACSLLTSWLLPSSLLVSLWQLCVLASFSSPATLRHVSSTSVSWQPFSRRHLRVWRHRPSCSPLRPDAGADVRPSAGLHRRPTAARRYSRPRAPWHLPSLCRSCRRCVGRSRNACGKWSVQTATSARRDRAHAPRQSRCRRADAARAGAGRARRQRPPPWVERFAEPALLE